MTTAYPLHLLPHLEILMPHFRAVLLLLVCLCACLVTAEEPKPDPREQLDTAIADTIRLLKAKDYKTLLERMVPPDDLKKIVGNESLEVFAREFGESDKPKVLLEALQSVQGGKPKLSDDGTQARFDLKKPVGSKTTISFKKVGKNWYIQN
jgi:hypothetical protein